MSRAGLVVVAGLAVALGAAGASAEPVFLSKQYARCTTCHYSPTGGGLLTPYGRSLSRQELSTTGADAAGAHQEITGREEAFLFGLTKDWLGPVSVGFDTRPAYLNFNVDGTGEDQTLFMTADLLAAYRVNGWTIYGEIGRQPQAEGSKIDSYEYWVGHQSENGLGFRVGRFMPAYGIHFADHTAYTRAPFGFDSYEQVYGLELSQTTDSHLLQVSIGPGYADSIIHNEGLNSFTATGRYEMDLTSRMALVVSGLYRDKSTLDPRNGAGGLAFGIAPTPHLNIWTEADAQFQQGTSGAPAYTFLNETAYEVYRGIWLKFSPQIRTDYGDTSGGLIRLAFEANLLPRTHWNVDASYYHDKSRVNDLVTKTFLLQLHLYL
jgi:hypothetical protein